MKKINCLLRTLSSAISFIVIVVKGLIIISILFPVGIFGAEKNIFYSVENLKEINKGSVHLISLLRQNLRPFDTLSLKYTEEKSTDGKNWTLVSLNKVQWDVKDDVLKRSSLLKIDSDTTLFKQFSVANGKLVVLQGNVSNTERNLCIDPSKLIDPVSSIQTTRIEASVRTGIDLWFFYYYDPKKTLLDLFNSKDARSSSTGITVNNDEITVPAFGVRRYVISSSKGMVVKILEGEIGDDSNGMVADEFSLKNGWLFPTTILTKENGIYVRRQKIDVNSIEVNKSYSPGDFFLTIPKGATVYDDIKGIDFQAPHPISSLDIKEIEGALLEIIKRANKEAK